MGVASLAAEALGVFTETHAATSSWSRDGELGDAAEVRHRLRSALKRAPVAFAPALGLIAAELPSDPSEGILEPEGEEIIEVVSSCLRRWGAAGAIALLSLIEQEAIGEPHVYRDELVRAAAADPGVMVALQASAERGVEAAVEIVAALAAQTFDRDLEALARRLADEVFPPGWPPASEP